MAKIFFTFVIATLLVLVGCNNINQIKQKASDAVEQVKDDTEKMVEDVKGKVDEFVSQIPIPNFSDIQLQSLADQYTKFLNEKSEIIQSGSIQKIEELKEKANEWKTKLQEMETKLLPEDKQKWLEWKQKISELELL